MKRRLLVYLGIVMSVSAIPGVSDAKTISFEEYPAVNANSNFLSDEYSSLGAHFFHTDDGSTWDGISKGDPGNWWIEGTNGPTFLGYNGASYGGKLEFEGPVSEFSFDVARSLGSQPGDTITVNAYDEMSVLLETLTIGLEDINKWTTVNMTKSNIFSVDWLGQGCVFHPYGIDNIQWTPVPEPATVMLFGMGLAGLAGISRRRNKNR